MSFKEQSEQKASQTAGPRPELPRQLQEFTEAQKKCDDYDFLIFYIQQQQRKQSLPPPPDLVSHRQQEEEQQAQLDKLREQEIKIEGHKERIGSLTLSQKNSNKTIQDSALEIKKLNQQNSFLGNDIKKKVCLIKKNNNLFQEQFKKKVDQLALANTELLKGKKENQVLLQNLAQYKKSNASLQDSLKLKDDKLLDIKTHDEINQLIGDSFEISNESVWHIKSRSGVKTGPLSFEELYAMRLSLELNSTYQVKKESDGVFKKYDDILELSGKLEKYTERKDDKIITRFFIKRDSVRVPFLGIISLTINDKIYKGNCTSLSKGGLFIEFAKLDEDLTKELKGRVEFNGQIFKHGLSAAVQIKNIRSERPKGYGLMFTELGSHEEGLILEYVKNYLEAQTKMVS